MIQILTADGQELDLLSSFTFNFEIEQPLLADDLPTPFSTEIGFPATDRNKRILGYIPALLLSPPVKKLNATILINGVAVYQGSMLFSGIREGCLYYTFTGVDAFETWSEPIGEYLEDDEYDVMDGRSEVIYVPTIIKKGQEFKQIYNEGRDHYAAPGAKHANFPFAINAAGYRPLQHRDLTLTPAVHVDAILRKVCPTIAWSAAIDSKLSQMVFLCQYNNWHYVDDESQYPVIPVEQRNFPLIKYRDVLLNVSKILGTAVYVSKRHVELKSASEVLTATPVDWDPYIIDDDVVLSTDRARNYRFAFGNGEEVLPDDIAADALGALPTVDSYDSTSAMRAAAGYERHKYARVLDRPGADDGDIYEIFAYIFQDDLHTVTIPNLLLASMVRRSGNTFWLHDAGAEETIERSTDWKLVTPVPLSVITDFRAGALNPQTLQMALVMDDVADGRSQRADVYVGLVKEGNQVTDDGRYFSSERIYDYNDGISLRVRQENTQHSMLANLYGRDRDVAQLRLRMRPAELAAVDLSRPVTFRGALWLIKSLSVTLTTDSDDPEVTGSFVRLDVL